MKKLFQYVLFAVLGAAPLFTFAQMATGLTSNLYQGLRGAEVTLLQQKLQAAGYFPADVVPTDFFGVMTLKAVQDFQAAKGIMGTGVVGPLTRQALGLAGNTTSAVAVSLAPGSTQALSNITTNLYQGYVGAQVTILQQRLKDLGYFGSTVTPTTFFGALTKKAVQDFQTANGIEATGFVGQLTRTALGGAPAGSSLKKILFSGTRAQCLAAIASKKDATTASAKKVFDGVKANSTTVRDASLAKSAATLSSAKVAAAGIRDAAFLAAKNISNTTSQTLEIQRAIDAYSVTAAAAQKIADAAQTAAESVYSAAVGKAQAVYTAAVKNANATAVFDTDSTCPAK